MRLLNTSTLCVCDFIMRVYSTLVMLCFSGDYIIGNFFIFIKHNITIAPSRSTSRTWGISGVIRGKRFS
jgi:hypothetical protein